MVSANDMYRLRLDTSKQLGDLTNAFENFRSDEEFLDVSIVCSNGVGRSATLKAHQLILAAYSPIFKEMFNSLNDKKDPVIFLKGISYNNLSSMLDFMYQGCVDIPKSVMSDFLADAQELQINGLRGENDGNDYTKQEPGIINQNMNGINDLNNQVFQSNRDVKMDLEQTLLMNGYVLPLLNKERKEKKVKEEKSIEEELNDFDNLNEESEETSLKRKKLLKNLQKLKAEQVDEQTLNYSFEVLKKDLKPVEHAYTDPIDEYEKIRAEQLFVKQPNKWVGGNNKRRSVYKCKLCEREVRTDRRAKHLRANHPEDPE